MTPLEVYRNLDARRRARDERGRREHRKSPGDPFNGDPVRELLAELEDALNYAEECARQGRLGEWAVNQLDLLLRQSVYTLSVGLQQERLRDGEEAGRPLGPEDR